MALRRLPALLLAWGVAWFARSAVGLADPEYVAPVTALDHAAVWTYSAVLLLCSGVAWVVAGIVGSDRITSRLGTTAAVAFAAAAVANALEDGLGVGSLGGLYVAGSLVSLVASLLFAAALLGIRARRLSVLALGLVAGYFSLFSIWVAAVLLIGSAWVAWQVVRNPGAFQRSPARASAA